MVQITADREVEERDFIKAFEPLLVRLLAPPAQALTRPPTT
jgi:hypothetical protein